MQHPFALAFAAGVALSCVASVAVSAQTWDTIPAGFEDLRGNAATSMPFRWTSGWMQTIYDSSLFAGLRGQTITALRLRRPAFFDDPAQPPSRSTIEIRMGTSTRPVANISGNRFDNTFIVQTLVVAQNIVNVPGTPAPAQADTAGADLMTFNFVTPFVVPASGDILLEMHAIDANFAINVDQWTDAVWLPQGRDLGLAIPAGQHGCGGVSSAPMRLDVAPGSEHPEAGRVTTIELTGARAASEVAMVVGFDPLTMASPVRFGADLTIFPMLSGCQSWAPWTIVVNAGRTRTGGSLTFTIDFPRTTNFPNAEIGVQAFVLEGLAGVSSSNGLVLRTDSIDFGPKAATVVFPANDNQVTWGVFRGLAPVIDLAH